VVEVESPGDGLLAGVTAQVGAVIPVGQTIAWLVAPGERPPAKAASAAPAARASNTAERTSTTAAHLREHTRVSSAPQISPKARRLAKELGVGHRPLAGDWPGGVISTEDVQAFADSLRTPRTAPPAASEALSQVARLMAERTTQSWTSVPHFFLVRDVDAAR